MLPRLVLDVNIVEPPKQYISRVVVNVNIKDCMEPGFMPGSSDTASDTSSSLVSIANTSMLCRFLESNSSHSSNTCQSQSPTASTISEDSSNGGAALERDEIVPQPDNSITSTPVSDSDDGAILTPTGGSDDDSYEFEQILLMLFLDAELKFNDDDEKDDAFWAQVVAHVGGGGH